MTMDWEVVDQLVRALGSLRVGYEECAAHPNVDLRDLDRSIQAAAGAVSGLLQDAAGDADVGRARQALARAMEVMVATQLELAKQRRP
jgi:hypothetical protein